MDIFEVILLFAGGILAGAINVITGGAGTIAGGYGIVNVAKRMPAHLVRRGILVCAVYLTGFAFWKYL